MEKDPCKKLGTFIFCCRQSSGIVVQEKCKSLLILVSFIFLFLFCFFSTQSMPCQTVMRHEWTRNCAGDEFARNWLQSQENWIMLLSSHFLWQTGKSLFRPTRVRHSNHIKYTKSQLLWKCLCGVIILTKIATKTLSGFLP